MKASLALLLTVALGLNAQIRDVDITGAGARAEGMGGAFIGVADDATSLVWNPAGLTQLEKLEASIVGRQIFENYKFSGYPKDDSKHFQFNFGSLAYPLSIGEQKLCIAIAYQNQIDLYQFGRDQGDLDVFSDQTGGINTFTFGTAYRIMPSLSVGAAANFWTGSSKFRYESDFGWDDDWSGFNWQFGALADLGQTSFKSPLRLGVSYRSAFDLKDKWVNTDDFDGQWTWQVPWMLGFGASYQIGENITLAADYEIRKFKKSKVTDDDDDDALIGYLSGSRDDVKTFRVGGEYLWVTDNAVFPLRAGYRYKPTLFTDLDGDQVSATGITFGTGYIHSRFAFDVAVTFENWTAKDYVKYTSTRIGASTIVYF